MERNAEMRSICRVDIKRIIAPAIAGVLIAGTFDVVNWPYRNEPVQTIMQTNPVATGLQSIFASALEAQSQTGPGPSVTELPDFLQQVVGHNGLVEIMTAQHLVTKYPDGINPHHKVKKLHPKHHAAVKVIQAAVEQPHISVAGVNGTMAAALKRLRICESGGRDGNYNEASGNGYYGAYQFDVKTWMSLGLPGFPSTASPALQDSAVLALAARSGWGQWPVCSYTAGLR